MPLVFPTDIGVGYGREQSITVPKISDSYRLGVGVSKFLDKVWVMYAWVLGGE